MFFAVIDKEACLVDAITRGATTVHGEAQVASAPCFDQVFGFRMIAVAAPERQTTLHMDLPSIYCKNRRIFHAGRLASVPS